MVTNMGCQRRKGGLSCWVVQYLIKGKEIVLRPGYKPNLQAYSTAETAVARLRLETPGDMGMETE